jgi:hypothetical protein
MWTRAWQFDLTFSDLCYRKNEKSPLMKRFVLDRNQEESGIQTSPFND